MRPSPTERVENSAFFHAGGTAVVSVGAYMGAADARVDTIYVWSQYQDNKPLEGSQRVLPIATYGGQ